MRKQQQKLYVMYFPFFLLFLSFRYYLTSKFLVLWQLELQDQAKQRKSLEGNDDIVRTNKLLPNLKKQRPWPNS